MCGASCHCAHAAPGGCSVRSAGCAGGEGGHALGSMVPVRAVLAAPNGIAPSIEFVLTDPIASLLPPQPVRPPLDHPPRPAC